MLLLRIVSCLLVCGLISCGGSGGGTPATVTPVEAARSFKMGFTPWLYDATTTAQDTTYSRLNTHGDMLKHHLMGGVPWQEAFDQTPYHVNFEGEISGRLSRTSADVDVFLAIDSLNSARDALTLYWGESQNMPLTGAWVNRSWSSPEVITAYINFASDMIDRFQPTHFEYATEISELILNNPAGYTDFLIFAQAVYSQLKVRYPNVKLMVSVALKSPASNEMQLIKASMPSIIPYTDVLGISVYPYAFFIHQDKGDPANLPADWLTQSTQISAGKPLAISETGWIAEDLDISTFGYSENSSEANQTAYLNLVLQNAQDMNMDFLIWWTVTDFDALWNGILGQDPVAKIWKDIGLYDENQRARSGLQVWDSWLAR